MFNASETIARALNSVVAQSRQPSLIIVVDDASNDGSAEVVEDMRLPRVDIVRLSTNGGAGRARNEGVRRATTSWIAFLDADDIWEPNFLLVMTDAVQELRVDFASSGGVRHTLSGDSINRLLDGPASACDRTRDFWRIGMKFVPPTSSSTLVRRELYEKLSGFPEDIRSGEDWVLWARMWLEGRFAFVNQPLFHWLQLDSGLSAGGRSSGDEMRTFRALAAVLWLAIRMRRPGTRWFIVWYARTFLRRRTRAAIGFVQRTVRRSPPRTA